MREKGTWVQLAPARILTSGEWREEAEWEHHLLLHIQDRTFNRDAAIRWRGPEPGGSQPAGSPTFREGVLVGTGWDGLSVSTGGGGACLQLCCQEGRSQGVHSATPKTKGNPES